MSQESSSILDYRTPAATPPPQRHAVGRQTVRGAVVVFLAEALILPTGLVTAAYLTRTLGQSGYGLFTIAASLVAWIEWSVTSMFTRAVIKFTAEAGDDWRPVGTTVVRQHFYVSCVVTAVMIALAGPICWLLDAPQMVPYLRLMALDIPIFSLAQAHRHILIGLGGYGRRAIGGAARWVARLILIIALIQMGFSVWGAILGSLGASLVEMIVYRAFAPAPLFTATAFPWRELYGFAVPLFMASMSLRLFEKLDIMLFKHLGGTFEDVGVYGAAQNLSIIPGILAMSFSPLLLSTLTRVLRAGDLAHARDMARDSIRGALLLFPMAAIVAGSAREIVVVIFGPHFVGAGMPLAWLVFGGLGMLVIAVTTSIMIAANKPGWTFALNGPMVPLAILGHYLFIPRYGSSGAAGVTATVACASALATIAGVYKLWQTIPPAGTWIRAAALTVGIYFLAANWHAPFPVVSLKPSLVESLRALLGVSVKVAACSAVVGVAMLLLGEFDRREIGIARSTIAAILSKFRAGRGAGAAT